MSEAARLDREIARVVRRQNCSGCGACVRLDPGLTMELDEAGFNRPVRARSSAPTTPPHASSAPTTRPDAARMFGQICPGRRVGSPRPPGARVHPTLGPVISAWEAWAADPETRFRGSSGGVLSALAGWLTETDQVSTVIGAGADPNRPARTVSVSITDRETALAAAGSRYAPVSALSAPGALEPGTALIGKPCEAAAARALLTEDRTATDDDRPVLLSFFCAGTPSQTATDRLVTELGLPTDTPLRRLWYRGRGWPGRFTAQAEDGREVSASYDESWGRALGPAVQWRCKICPDGVGESSDLSAADFWHTDERGYPDFTEGDGCSAVLARTPRGQRIIERAFAEGVLIGRPIDPDAVAAVQPLQVGRRTTLVGRLLGSTLAGRPGPRYRRFGLLRLGIGDWRETARTGRGTFRRVRGRR